MNMKIKNKILIFINIIKTIIFIISFLFSVLNIKHAHLLISIALIINLFFPYPYNFFDFLKKYKNKETNNESMKYYIYKDIGKYFFRWAIASIITTVMFLILSFTEARSVYIIFVLFTMIPLFGSVTLFYKSFQFKSIYVIFEENEIQYYEYDKFKSSISYDEIKEYGIMTAYHKNSYIDYIYISLTEVAKFYSRSDKMFFLNLRLKKVFFHLECDENINNFLEKKFVNLERKTYSLNKNKFINH